jgi:hypothetical protein
MARPGFFNENINRDYPFLHDWFDGFKLLDTDPDSPTYQECVETQLNGLAPDWRVRDLPDFAIADFGCVMGVESGYIEGIHSVWLQQVRRKGSMISFEFHSDAPGLDGRALIFDRDITSSDFVTESVEDVKATDEALYNWPACSDNDYDTDLPTDAGDSGSPSSSSSVAAILADDSIPTYTLSPIPPATGVSESSSKNIHACDVCCWEDYEDAPDYIYINIASSDPQGDNEWCDCLNIDKDNPCSNDLNDAPAIGKLFKGSGGETGTAVLTYEGQLLAGTVESGCCHIGQAVLQCHKKDNQAAVWRFKIELYYSNDLSGCIMSTEGFITDPDGGHTGSCNCFKLPITFTPKPDGEQCEVCEITAIFFEEEPCPTDSDCGTVGIELPPGGGGGGGGGGSTPPPGGGCGWCFDAGGQLQSGDGEDYPWTEVEPWRVNFRFEDSKECAGDNGDVQCGYASKCFKLEDSTTFSIELDGMIEKQNPGYDGIKVVITDRNTGDVILTMSDKSDAFGGGCEMTARKLAESVTLGPGEYEIEVFVSTEDGLWHKDAYWNIYLDGLSQENEMNPCCPCEPELSCESSVLEEPTPECPCDPCEYEPPDCSLTSPPLWEGYMVSGSLDELAGYLSDCETIAGPIPIEPATIQNMAGGFVQSVNVANADRTRATSADGCRDLCFEDQECVEDCIACNCVAGDVFFKEGYNSLIKQDTLRKTLTFSGQVGAGAGEPCSEIPICEEEKEVLANSPYISTLSGGPTCGDVVMSINGVGGKYFTLSGGKGVDVIPYPEFNRIIVDVNLQDLAICPGDLENECPPCPEYSTDPCACGPAIIPTTKADPCGEEELGCSYEVTCVSGLWTALVPGENSTVQTDLNSGPVKLSWGFKDTGEKEELSFEGSAPPKAQVKFDTDYTVGKLKYTYVDTSDYPLTGATLQLDVTIGVSNKVVASYHLPLEISEGTISLDKAIPFTLKAKTGLETVFQGFKESSTLSKSFTVGAGESKEVELVVQFKEQNQCCHPEDDPLHDQCCDPSPCNEGS